MNQSQNSANPSVSHGHSYVYGASISTGKEWESETGTYYFGARRYDPTIGMWLGMDPVREFYSPYNYVGGRPLVRFDLDGKQTPEQRVQAVDKANEYVTIGSSYLWGGRGQPGDDIDCSGLIIGVYPDLYVDNDYTQTIFNATYSVDDPMVGDLIFFTFEGGSTNGHVGIVTEVGENGSITFSHSGSSTGPTSVIFTMGSGNYWDNAFSGFRRQDVFVFPEEFIGPPPTPASEDILDITG